jgi:hypothetical protein
VSTRGVLYILIGKRPLYVNAVRRAATSLKRVMPDLPIALVSDGEIDGPFDHRIRIAESDPAKIAPGDFPCRAKVIGMKQTPFEHTIYLDADTSVLADLGEVFELLDGFDAALAHAQGRVAHHFDDVPEAFPEFNCGVIAYRNTPFVQSFLDEWLREYDVLAPLHPWNQDQPSFRRLAYRTPGLRIATLTSEFNRKFDTAGYVKGQVRVLHGWPLEGGYGRVEEAVAVAGAENPWVFAGGRVFDHSGKQIADFLGRWYRLRTLRHRLMSR